MPNCIVKGCSNRHGFTFPKDPDLRLRWVLAIRRNILFNPSRGAKVCHEHFRDTDIKPPLVAVAGTRIKRALYPGRIPSIFPWTKEEERARLESDMNPCAVPLCKGFGQYPFPKDPNLRHQWLKAIWPDEDQPKYHASFKICTDHFQPKDMNDRDNNPVLRPHSVPSIFLRRKETDSSSSEDEHWSIAVPTSSASKNLAVDVDPVEPCEVSGAVGEPTVAPVPGPSSSRMNSEQRMAKSCALKRCLVPHCQGQGHYFLPQDPSLKRKWLRAIWPEGNIPHYNKRCRICPDHFAVEDLIKQVNDSPLQEVQHVLRPDAVPTLLLHNQESGSTDNKEVSKAGHKVYSSGKIRKTGQTNETVSGVKVVSSTEWQQLSAGFTEPKKVNTGHSRNTSSRNVNNDLPKNSLCVQEGNIMLSEDIDNHEVFIKVEEPDTHDMDSDSLPNPTERMVEDVHIKSEEVDLPDVNIASEYLEIEVKSEEIDDSSKCFVDCDPLQVEPESHVGT